MRGIKALPAALGLLSVICASAPGQSLVVETRTGTTLESANTYSSGASFTIPLTSTTDRINIYSTGGLADIGTISFSGSTSASPVDVIIGSGPVDTSPTANPSNAADDWGGVSFPFNARLYGAIAGNLTGSINPQSIVRLEAHGQVSGAITASLSSGTAIGYLQLGSTTSAGTITAGNSSAGGNILTIAVESSGTSLAGEISALSGGIGVITAAGSISISGNGIRAMSGIGNVIADGITADITANANSGSGGLGCLEVTGNLSGNVTASSLGLYDTFHSVVLVVGGSVDGELVFEGDLNDEIVIGGADGSGMSLTSLHVGGNFRGAFHAAGDVGSITIDGDVEVNDLVVLGDHVPVITAFGAEIGSIAILGNLEAFTDEETLLVPQIYADTIGDLYIGGSAKIILSADDEDSPIDVGTLTVVGDLRRHLFVGAYDAFVVEGSLREWTDAYFDTQLNFVRVENTV